MATFTNGTGFKGLQTLRSYQHAKKIFVDSNFRLSPKYGFLFYVEFDFNPLITNLSNTTAQEMGMIVKSVNLPSFAIEVKAHNAYNRKNYVQNAIKYDPINIVFHDDQSDNVLNFWYDYYSYYYRDSDYADATYGALHKYQSRPTFDWGYSPRPAIGYNGANGAQPYQYIQAIRLYSLYQSQFDEYELINPIITNFRHGELANGSNNMLQHEMSIQYEAVKYLTGHVTPNTAGGFIDLHYDLTPSPNLGDHTISPAYLNSTSDITDFSNKATAMGTALNQGLFSTAAPASSGAAEALNKQAQKMGASTANNGGTIIPALGSATQGITQSSMVTQNLQSAGVGIAGGAASSLANGVTGSLGPTGQSVLGLAAAAVANPQQTLQTIENMATSAALGYAINQVSAVVGAGTEYLSNQASELFGTLSEQLSTAASEAATNVANWFE